MRKKYYGRNSYVYTENTHDTCREFVNIVSLWEKCSKWWGKNGLLQSKLDGNQWEDGPVCSEWVALRVCEVFQV